MALKLSDVAVGLAACVVGVICAAPSGAMGRDDVRERPATRPERRAPDQQGGRAGAWQFDDLEGEPNGELSQDEIETIMSFLRENRPEMARHLERLRTADPQRAREVFTQLRRKLKHMNKVKQQDPEMYRLHMKDNQLDHKAKELGRQIRNTTDPDEAQRMKEELRQLIRQHFQARQEMREMGLRKLERRLEELRNQLATRRASQERLVEQRFQKLVAEEDLAEW